MSGGTSGLGGNNELGCTNGLGGNNELGCNNKLGGTNGLGGTNELGGTNVPSLFASSSPPSVSLIVGYTDSFGVPMD